MVMPARSREIIRGSPARASILFRPFTVTRKRVWALTNSGQPGWAVMSFGGPKTSIRILLWGTLSFSSSGRQKAYISSGPQT